MVNPSAWNNLPYFPISQLYRRRFGTKVYKVPVNMVATCPNREGLRGMKVCNFCDVWGSAANPEVRDEPMREQITKIRKKMQDVYKAKKFLVYFQAYTSTFTKVSNLRTNFEVASAFEDVVGMVVGTRPDCLNDGGFDLWNEFTQRGYFVSLELGAQSFDEKQLLWMRRGHTAEKTIQAVYRIRKKAPQVDLGVHLMFGQPGETDEQIIETARLVSALPVDNVKLHNLHVLTNTPLEDQYRRGEFEPLSREDYARRVALFLEYLRPDLAIHRLTAVARDHKELVAPHWASRKMENYQAVLDKMKSLGSFQGRYYEDSYEFDLQNPQGRKVALAKIIDLAQRNEFPEVYSLEAPRLSSRKTDSKPPANLSV